jgi:hypothetical protein
MAPVVMRKPELRVSHGKLLLAALCEAIVNIGNEVFAGVFSPCGGWFAHVDKRLKIGV